MFAAMMTEKKNNPLQNVRSSQLTTELRDDSKLSSLFQHSLNDRNSSRLSRQLKVSIEDETQRDSVENEWRAPAERE